MTCAQCQATGGSRLPRNSSLTRTLILSALRELFAICAASSHCPSRQHPPRTETFRRQRFWLSRRHSEAKGVLYRVAAGMNDTGTSFT